MKGMVILTLAALQFCGVATLFGQEPATQDPAWVLFEKGKSEIAAQGELGIALRYFRQALDKRVPFPEVEEAIGDIHRLEGNFLMAEIQYNKAYEQRGSFQVREEQYRVQRKLADIYKTQEKYKQMEDALLTILEDQPYFAQPDYQRYSAALYSTYRDKGIDYFLKLYRVENIAFAAHAHGELTWFYYRTGRYQQAVRHGLFGVNIFISESVPELRRYNPEFEFTNLKAFLDIALERNNIRDYLSEDGFYSQLYYLAAASHASKLSSQAENIWRYLSATPAALRFRDLSRRQLEAPWIEAYLNPSARKIEYPTQ